MNDQLKKLYFEEFKPDRLSAPPLARTLVIGFIASIGAGKSFLAENLREKLNIPVFDNDGIRRWLNHKGVDGANPLPELVIDIARSRRDLLLASHISYILDAGLTLTYRQDARQARERGATLLLVRLKCPPEVGMERIKERERSGQSVSQATIERFMQREKERAKARVDEKDIFFDFDSVGPFNRQLDHLIDKIKTYSKTIPER